MNGIKKAAHLSSFSKLVSIAFDVLGVQQVM